MTAASTTPADPDLVETSAPGQKDGRHGGWLHDDRTQPVRTPRGRRLCGGVRV